ncbi:hypothetical protein ACIPSA_24705 [Streptomyces sp. NPDC086549]|uniref:hypothetical protein n=1 Tax=Streptomyces sp. NPDC086549 TaxID=3365752 RepID=UPI0038144561
MGRTAETPQQETHERDGAGLHLHMRTLHPSVPVPYLTREELTRTAHAATTRLPSTPPVKDLAFYGGLGALTVAGALEWPVAMAIGGATWLLRSGRKENQDAGVLM